MALDMNKPVVRIEFNISKEDLISLICLKNEQAKQEAIYDLLDMPSNAAIDTILSINGEVILDETVHIG